MFSAMESVLSLMREVEICEKAASEAKVDAARGGVDIFDKIEELKQMVAQAKEANDMVLQFLTQCICLLILTILNY